MRGKDYLAVAQELVEIDQPTEAHYRTSAGRSYYALFLEARDRLRSWGFVFSQDENIHREVRWALDLAKDTQLNEIASQLKRLREFRNVADYDLGNSLFFAKPVVGKPSESSKMLLRARNAIALLDRIDADPERRKAAIASIPSTT